MRCTKCRTLRSRIVYLNELGKTTVSARFNTAHGADSSIKLHVGTYVLAFVSRVECIWRGYDGIR